MKKKKKVSGRFSNTEIRHLKWMMIKHRGYSLKQAEEEIELMKKEDAKNHGREFHPKRNQDKTGLVPFAGLHIPNNARGES